jgi:hypothetical protein
MYAATRALSGTAEGSTVLGFRAAGTKLAARRGLKVGSEDGFGLHCTPLMHRRGNKEPFCVVADEMQSLPPSGLQTWTLGSNRLQAPSGLLPSRLASWCRPRMADGGRDHGERQDGQQRHEHSIPPPRDRERFAAVSEGQHLEPDARLSAREPW